MARLIGIHGGTFDPIHFGHLRSALEVKESLGLDEVLFIPSFQPVHRDIPSVSAKQRCEMVSLAIQGQAGFKLDKTELNRAGNSFMVDTLTQLKLQHPQDILVLIMGTDAFASFSSWRQPAKILELVNIVVMNRPGDKIPMQGESFKLWQQHQAKKLNLAKGQIVEQKISQLDISSTHIKQQIQLNKSINYLLPTTVINYIKKEKLYSYERTTN